MTPPWVMSTIVLPSFCTGIRIKAVCTRDVNSILLSHSGANR